MIDLPECSISDTHARGLRRAEDRWADHRQSTWEPSRKPKRFGPRVRQMHEELLATHGAGRVVMAPLEKKSAMWLYVERDETGNYLLIGHRLVRKSGRVTSGAGRMPITATPHCYERFIQGFLRDGVEWVEIMTKTFEQVLTANSHHHEPGSPVFETARWVTPGNFKVWLRQGLAMVDVPEVGPVVMRTLVNADALIGPNRLLWEELAKDKTKARLCERPIPGDEV